METKHNKPLIVAHRGAHSEGIVENTLEAFTQAFTYPVDAIEGDFHLTLDHHIVCHHNSYIKQLAIKKSTLQKLREIQPDLPTLNEVLNIIPLDKIIYIEIKCGIEIFEHLVSCISKSSLTNQQIVIISFDAHVVHQAKITYPHMRVYFLYEFEKNEIPSFKNLKKVLDVCHADGLSTNVTSYLDENFVQDIIDAGYSYHIWTAKSWKIDSIEKIEMLKVLGVASITLDAIDLL